METWLRDVAGGPVDAVEVTERKPEEILIWRSSGARIALELEEGTFGTAVEIKAQHAELRSQLRRSCSGKAPG